MKKALFIIVGTAGLMFGFQNCSEVQFADATSKGILVKSDGSNTDNIDNGTDGEQTDTTTTDDTTTTTTDTTTTDDTTTVDPTTTETNDDGGPQEAQNYICILNGPGKSIRVGLLNILAGNGHTPDTVCMTENACNNIISQKFDVKGPEKRGFCPHKNPHVTNLSDAELQNLIDGL